MTLPPRGFFLFFFIFFFIYLFIFFSPLLFSFFFFFFIYTHLFDSLSLPFPLSLYSLPVSFFFRLLSYDSSPLIHGVTLGTDSFEKAESVRVRYDLVDCYIDICSPVVLQLFHAEFDYGDLRFTN